MYVLSHLQRRLIGVRSQADPAPKAANGKLPGLPTQGGAGTASANQSSPSQVPILGLNADNEGKTTVVSKTQAGSPSPASMQQFQLQSSVMSNLGVIYNRNSRYRQQVARQNLLEQANKRMQEWLEKQKKQIERQKKVNQYNRYVRNKTIERFNHRQEFAKTANQHNVSWR